MEENFQMNNEKYIISADVAQNEDQSVETTLTEEQIKQVYDKLNEENADADKLAAAHQETEDSVYEDIEEIPEFDINTAEKVLPEDVLKQTILDYDLGLSDEDALALVSVISKYRKDKNIKVYDILPEGAKNIVKNIMRNINTPNNKSNRISKENASRFFIDNFINDAELQNIIDEFNTSINSAYAEMGSDLSKLFTEAFDAEFDKIEEYETTDPEKAERVKNVKEAFADAKPPFNKLLEWINPKVKKIIYKKADLRFRDETSYFNNKVNVTDVKVPNIEELLDVIKLYDPSKTDAEIKRFIVAICRHVYNQDFNDIKNLAYIYRLVDSIYKYKFMPTILEDEASKSLFGAISVIIDKINSL